MFAEEEWGEDERTAELVQQDESEDAQPDAEEEADNRGQEGEDGVWKERQGTSFVYLVKLK